MNMFLKGLMCGFYCHNTNPGTFPLRLTEERAKKIEDKTDTGQLMSRKTNKISKVLHG